MHLLHFPTILQNGLQQTDKVLIIFEILSESISLVTLFKCIRTRKHPIVYAQTCRLKTLTVLNFKTE